MRDIYDISNYNYALDERLIAQKPLEKRDISKLLILNRKTGEITHDKFFNIYKYFDDEDCLVLNNTKVLPARLFGTKSKTGAKIEILFLDFKKEKIAEVIMKNSRRVVDGDFIEFPAGLVARVVEKHGKTVEVEFNFGKKEFFKILKKYGVIPLPPYIKEDKFSPKHKEIYQTVYAKKEGAKAAPTAGLHFTKDLVKKLKQKGIEITHITLHTGLGTFEPLLEKDIREHKMHKEYFEINKISAEKINLALKNKKSVIAAGTTSLRAIEHCTQNGRVMPQKGKTDLYIYPGYEFKIVNKLITNFHLPKTTLFILVCAFAGIDNIKKAYSEAIKEKYRFYSYGDAMLIL